MTPANALARMKAAREVIRKAEGEMNALGRELQVAGHADFADETREVMAYLSGAEHSLCAVIHLVERETN